MSEPSSLTERLAASLRRSAELRAHEQEAEASLVDESDPRTQVIADKLELSSQADVAEMDEKSDRETEQMLKMDAHESQRAKMAYSAALRLLQATGQAGRELVFRALVLAARMYVNPASQAHVGVELSRTGEPLVGCEHLVMDLRVVCASCLSEPDLSPRDQDLILRLSSPVLSPEDYADLASDRFLDLLLSRPAAKNPTTLDVRLANLLRET